jgi:pimeloyl-ACP methyl ester carboxylesterase
MDLRGTGESSTTFADYSSRAVGSDVIALARQFGTARATVIGTSMAANSAAWAALVAPELIEKMVLIGGFLRVHAANPVLKPTMNLLFGMRPWGPGMWIRYWRTLFPSRKPADLQTYAAQLQANLSEPGRLEALRAMLNRPDEDAVGSRLTRVTAPSLVVMGTRDPDFKDPTGEANWIAAQLHASVVLVDGAGHYPHAEMPERVGPEIVAFLAQASSGSCRAAV